MIATGAEVPWLSVVMPTYNGAAHLAAALESVRAQEDDRLEIIAVDDGSTDSTLAILKDYAALLPLHIVEQPHQGDWVANSNHGANRARGDWLCFLHQDDRWSVNRLAILKENIRALPQVGLWLHPSWYIDGQDKCFGRWRCPLPVQNKVLNQRMVLDRLLVQNYISMPAPLFRRESFLQVGGLQEGLWYTADWDLWLKLVAACPTAYLSEPLSFFRIHSGSQTIARNSRHGNLREQLMIVLEKHLLVRETLFKKNEALRKVARFSAEMNSSLAGWINGSNGNWLTIANEFLSLGPLGWHSFFRDSRLLERGRARLRAGLAN